MSSFVTQCPHCHTQFRVSRDQLSLARGVVRCGACLEVFNAAQQVLQRSAASPAPISEPESAPEPPAPPLIPTDRDSTPVPDWTNQSDQALWTHDDLDLDSMDLDEELAKLERQERELALQAAATGEGFLLPTTEAPDTPEQDLVEPDWEEQPTIASEPPVTEAIDEPPAAAPRRIEPPLGRLDSTLTQASAFTPTPTPTPTPSVPLPPPGEQVNRRPPKEPPLFELDSEPLQLHWQARRKPWGRWLAWSLLILIALLGLAGQYVAYNFEQLARQDRYRPWFEQLCPSLGCTLPSRVDIRQIRSSNLVVRSHPEFAGALVVDAIIYNRASFAQPFPLLEIRFSDINGQQIANRSFKPGEYLSGELAGRTEMPPQTPIHIALDILDPGAEAVNYNLGFRSPE